MTYKGRIKNGVVVFDENVALPEGAEVEVSVSEPALSHSDEGSARTLTERMKPFTGKATGLPPDAARNVDYYLYLW